MVGDRGSVTQVRIRQLKALPGAGWITALRAPQVAALARDDGPLQMSLSGDQNFAEITDARYPGERMICSAIPRWPASAPPNANPCWQPRRKNWAKSGRRSGGPGERRWQDRGEGRQGHQ